MIKWTVKNIIQFRKLSAIRQSSFIANLTAEEEDDETEKRNYWHFSLTTISSVCRNEKVELIREKIDDLATRKKSKTLDRTKQMYQRNIDALYNYEEYDFSTLKPVKIEFQVKPRSSTVINVKGLPVKVSPSYVFSFTNKGKKEIGAIWFVAQIGGFRNDEFGIFLELLYRYLVANYGKSYTVNPSYCRVVEVVTGRERRYSEIDGSEIYILLNGVVDKIKTMMKRPY